jgi:hypothetical protein
VSYSAVMSNLLTPNFAVLTVTLREVALC